MILEIEEDVSDKKFSEKLKEIKNYIQRYKDFPTEEDINPPQLFSKNHYILTNHTL